MNQSAARFPTRSRPGILFRLAMLQLLATAVFSLTLYYCFDAREALSAFLGGLIAVLASVFSALRLFTARRSLQAGELLMRFYISEALKVIFSLTMIGIFIIVLKVSMLPFIIAYLLAAVIVNLLVLLLPAPE